MNEPKLPQYLSDLLHLRYVAGVRAKEGVSRGMFTFECVGKPECGTPGCLLGWLQATPEGKDVFWRHFIDLDWQIDFGTGPFTSQTGINYPLFCINPYSSGRTDAEELDHRLAWVDEEITRECIKQGLCPEETPKAYEHALEKEYA